MKSIEELFAELKVVPVVVLDDAKDAEPLAKAVVEAMLKHNSVLLTNHGQVVCGKDFDQVYERANFF